MKEFVSHIDYLIQKHDCVIIPDFGGFVLSHERARFLTDGSILPPKVTIGFNPELKYNDGLLAESYMNMHSTSYDVACHKINEAVKKLNTLISRKQPVQIGCLGVVVLGENNRLFFTPNENLSVFHPETFGLSRVNLKRLCDLEKSTEKNKKISLVRRIFAGTGAAAAAILLFFIASTPVSEDINTQKSSFFTDLVSTTNNKSEIKATNAAPDNTLELQNKVVATKSEEFVPLVKKPIDAQAEERKQEEPKSNNKPVVVSNTDAEKIVKQPEPDKNIAPKVNQKGNYFVIIGSAGDNGEAQKLMTKLKSKGLSGLNILEADNRFRIYVASFSDKRDANEYLQSFKKENPQMHDAWVYMKKN